MENIRQAIYSEAIKSADDLLDAMIHAGIIQHATISEAVAEYIDGDPSEWLATYRTLNNLRHDVQSERYGF